MTGSDRERDVEPIEPGWYAYSGGSQVMIFHLRETGQWSVHLVWDPTPPAVPVIAYANRVGDWLRSRAEDADDA